MWSAISRPAANAPRAARTATRAGRRPRPALVCATCRAAAAAAAPVAAGASPTTTPPPPPLPPPRPRLFSTSAARGHDDPPPRVPSTHYDLFPQTFPDGPPPRAPFSPDLTQLRREFLQRQAAAHPDRAPPERRRSAAALSARINDAYHTLRCPLRRAQYLLALRGIAVDDDAATLHDRALLMQVMDAREALDAVQDERALAALRAANRESIEASVRVLEHAFRRAEWEAAAREAVRLRYWVNIEESIRGWEKGEGGGGGG